MDLNKKNMKNIMILILFAILSVWLIFNYSILFNVVKYVIKVFLPVIVGIIIAFIINIPMKQIERKVFKIHKRKYKKIIRIISLLLSIILIFGLISLIVILIIPEFINAISNISDIIPKKYDVINDVISKVQLLYPDIKNYLKDININNIINTSLGTTANVVSLLIAFLSDLISIVIVFFVGFIISIYILIDKENLTIQTKKFMNAFIPEKIVLKIVKIVKLVNSTFTKFFTGQCLDAALMGFLLFIILSILKMPYAVILGVLFAITALIPFVGAFITLAIGIVLVSVINPIYAIWYILAFFIVQQIDENFTYPKIVGGSVGLPALWALIAVLVGGNIFGFIGMFISIPISSIIYTLLKDYINEKNKKN